MRKILILAIFLLLVPYIAAFAGNSATETIDSSPPSEGTWAGGISSTYQNPNPGYLNISIYGSSWSATVTLQRSFKGDSNWYDVETWTSNDQKSLYDPERGVIYRIGVKNGEYTSGSVVVRLSF